MDRFRVRIYTLHFIVERACSVTDAGPLRLIKLQTALLGVAYGAHFADYGNFYLAGVLHFVFNTLAYVEA